MVQPSRVALRTGLAAAVAVLALCLCGTIAVAQQVAVNTEDAANAEGQTALEPSPDEERPSDDQADRALPYERGAGNNHRRYGPTLSLSRAAERSGNPLRDRRGTYWFSMVGR
jgi:hypothetical protein